MLAVFGFLKAYRAWPHVGSSNAHATAMTKPASSASMTSSEQPIASLKCCLLLMLTKRQELLDEELLQLAWAGAGQRLNSRARQDTLNSSDFRHLPPPTSLHLHHADGR